MQPVPWRCQKAESATLICLVGIFLYYVLLFDLSSFQSQKSSGVCFLSEAFSSGLEHWCKKKERRRRPVYIMLSDLHCCLGFVFSRCLVCEAFQFCGKTLQTYIMCLWYSARCGARRSCRFFTCMCMRWKYPECHGPPVHFLLPVI